MTRKKETVYEAKQQLQMDLPNDTNSSIMDSTCYVNVRNALNYKSNPDHRERTKGLSMTVPDQAMSVAEILRRFASGLPLGGVRVSEYDEENDLPDPRHMDLADRQELKEHFENEIQEAKKTWYAMHKAKKETKMEKQMDSAPTIQS